MTNYLTSVGMIISMTMGIGWSELAFGQEIERSAGTSTATASGNATAAGNAIAAGAANGFGNATGNELQTDHGSFERILRSANLGALSQQQSRTMLTGSRSVSFKKDGKRVTIVEDETGISVSSDGETVQAKDAVELKNRFPEAYRLYEDHIGAASFGGMAGGFAGGSAGGGSHAGGPGKFSASSSGTRRVSMMENGKKVSITENDTGITVSVDGNPVRAKNAAELKLMFPDTFKIYEKYRGNANGLNAGLDANFLLRGELEKLRTGNANNPQMRSLIERMMQNIDR